MDARTPAVDFTGGRRTGTARASSAAAPPKSAEEIKAIHGAVATSPLFEGLSQQQMDEVVTNMFECEFKAGQTVIQQREKGDNFYIVQSGTFAAYLEQVGDKAVKEYSAGTPNVSFGELALMYGTPRTATVKAVGACELWQISRRVYRQIELHYKVGRLARRVERVAEVTGDTQSGAAVEGTAEEVAAKRKEDPLRYRVVGTSKDDAGAVDTIILPVSGKGLWSTIYGYIALESDKDHVRGITFYKHGETPGLGGEVENPQWTAQWVGKSIRRADGGIGVIVKKGQVDEGVQKEKDHYVDGLAGATITSKGVDATVKLWLGSAGYGPYLPKN